MVQLPTPQPIADPSVSTFNYPENSTWAKLVGFWIFANFRINLFLLETECLCSVINSYFETLIPGVSVFGDGAF